LVGRTPRRKRKKEERKEFTPTPVPLPTPIPILTPEQKRFLELRKLLKLLQEEKDELEAEIKELYAKKELSRKEKLSLRALQIKLGNIEDNIDRFTIELIEISVGHKIIKEEDSEFI